MFLLSHALAAERRDRSAARRARNPASSNKSVRSSLRIITLIAPCILLGSALHAQGVRLTVTPARPMRGALVRLTLSAARVPDDSIVRISGTMAGEPLHFTAAVRGDYRAIGAVPVDPTTSIMAQVIIDRTSGRADTVRLAVEPPALPPPSERLSVASRFSRPLDSATQARVEEEGVRARAVGRRSHESPPLWSAPFRHPRASAITSRFGTGRTFNGRVTTRHLGVDFRGAAGTPVRAANRGVVALVDTFFLGGRVIYVDHGGGVVTGYMHLSRALVAVGDTVSRGQNIGLVGATGRVTGPHLHWIARYGELTVNPLDLVGLDW